MTDTNDRELVNRSDMAVLLPPVSEVGGSVLALALLEFMAVSGAKHPDRRDDMAMTLLELY